MIFSNFITKVCSRQAFCSDEIFYEKILGPSAQKWKRNIRDTVRTYYLGRNRDKKPEKNAIHIKKQKKPM